jgi:dTDP-4-amino-4,6-dideoxygalactose transaminase
VARKITPKTKGIIPVHLAGNIADMARLTDLAKAHNLFLLEDACHAWGGRWNDKGVGAIGDCGVFSFQFTKNITAAEGGIVITTNEKLAEPCRSYTNCGRFPGKPWYYHENIGTNLRMTEFAAAVLLAQLDRYEGQADKRQANADILDRGLAGIPGVLTVKQYPGLQRRAYHIYPFRVDADLLGVSRDRFVDALVAEGVPATGGYTTPLYKFDFFRHGPVRKNRGCEPYLAAGTDYADVCCPVCEKVCDTTIWLKHSMLLAEPEAIEKLVAAVRKVAQNAGELAKP